MTDSRTEDATIYKVVMNREEQYSIWPNAKATPTGWSETGKVGSGPECLQYVEERWSDMRPRTLRDAMTG